MAVFRTRASGRFGSERRVRVVDSRRGRGILNLQFPLTKWKAGHSLCLYGRTTRAGRSDIPRGKVDEKKEKKIEPTASV